MFTGIVEMVGSIRSVKKFGDGIELKISAHKIMADLHINNSISVNGVCLTVTHRTRSSFIVQAVKETLSKTNLGELTVGDEVNLERSVTLQDRLGGHIVQGHIDSTGVITSIRTLRTSWMYTISFPKKYRKYLIPVGSISVDGTSLTTAVVRTKDFSVAIIPFTYQHTVFHQYKKGTRVNLEFDIIGKYLESLVHYKK